MEVIAGIASPSDDMLSDILSDDSDKGMSMAMLPFREWTRRDPLGLAAQFKQGETSAADSNTITGSSSQLQISTMLRSGSWKNTCTEESNDFSPSSLMIHCISLQFCKYLPA